jgi:hypothetical protein
VKKPSTYPESLEQRIAPAFSALINLANLTGPTGAIFTGGADGDSLGRSVAAAGDVNGDGLDDFIIGADGVDAGGESRGAAYVIFGGKDALTSTPSLSSLDGTNGFALLGNFDGGKTGASVEGAGDVNGDGFDDLIVGAALNSEGGIARGSAFVVFGRAAFPESVALASLNGSTGFRFRGASDEDLAGSAVGTAGDLNGDGYADVIIGARGVNGNGEDRGAAYIIFGKPGGFEDTLTPESLDGMAGFTIRGSNDLDGLGTSVSSAGDVNGDGFSDIIIGAPQAGAGGNDLGAAYVIFGRSSAFAASVDPGSLSGTNGFRIAGAQEISLTGFSVSDAGDINGDGFDDVLVGAPFANEGGMTRGAVYVVFGRPGSFDPSVPLQDLPASDGFKLSGAANGDRAGFSLSGAGDLNGDGFGDIVIGADSANGMGSNRGVAYVIFGKDGGFPAASSLGFLNGKNGFAIAGANDGDSAGASVGAAGDVNGDGFGDLVVGAPSAGVGGAGYVILGQADTVITFSSQGKVAKFTDVDGDLVTVRVSKGQLAQADFTFSDGIWQALDLSDDEAEFSGTNLSIMVKRAGGGDGFVNLGAIRATGVDLGAVSLRGDLGQIDAGDAVPATPALESLKVTSLGTLPEVTQPQGTIDPIRSDIVGALGKLRVTGDVQGAVNVIGGTNGWIGSVKIGGDLDGSAGGSLAGLLRAGGNIGAVAVEGSVIGGADFSGIVTGGKLGQLKIGGDLLSEDLGKPVVISALGTLNPGSSAAAVAIAGINIQGAVTNAKILAGYTTSLGAANRDSSIGPVKVGGNWRASSLVAGVADTGLPGFGIGDSLITGDNTPGLVASIARLTIKGTALGSSDLGDHFGITAERLLRVTIGGTKQVLTTEADSIALDPFNNDFRLRDFTPA